MSAITGIILADLFERRGIVTHNYDAYGHQNSGRWRDGGRSGIAKGDGKWSK